MAFEPNDLYKNFERVVKKAADLSQALEDIFAQHLADKSKVFAFRGVHDARYGFHSSLFRRTWWTRAVQQCGKSLDSVDPPSEDDIAKHEERILAEAHMWGLHDAERGRLSILRQLAVLQHHHAPTRLIDVSLNVWIGVWFAVQEQRRNGKPQQSDTQDGRLFVIDITKRLINERDEWRSWEDDLSRPWKSAPKDWTEFTWAWKPAPANRRIAAQHGAFLFGGVPTVSGGKNYPKSPNPGTWLTQKELRRCTSVPLRFHKVASSGRPQQGRPPGSPVYTLRICKEAKPELRERLEKLQGLAARTIYPDLPGFGHFGTPWLADRAPTND